MKTRRAVTGRRIAVALTVLVVVILAAPVCLLHFSARPPAPPQAYQKTKDAVISVLWPLWQAGIHPCTLREGTRASPLLVGLPTDECFKMQPPRRFSGIWVDEFEGSAFLEGVTDPAEALRRRSQIYYGTGLAMEWLEWSTNMDELDPSLQSVLARSTTTRLFHLEFEGRRTAYRGDYGHMGIAESEVIVDRVISARLAYVFPHPEPFAP